MTKDEPERFHAETRAAWRDWLERNHATARSVWLVSWKKHTGGPAVGYDEAVSEALAFGWVDSKPAKLDDDRTMLYFSPRKPGSAWSRPNKDRVRVLQGLGLMADAGTRVGLAAQADGSWSKLDDVETAARASLGERANQWRPDPDRPKHIPDSDQPLTSN